MASKPAVTAAIRELRAHNVAHRILQYAYVPRGGAAASAQALGVDQHSVVKTLIMQNDLREPLIVLMHGDHEVSTKALARHLGVRTIEPCTPQLAERYSGYQLGGTSPFGTRRKMPVYVQASIVSLPRIFINGGKRGLLVEIDPADLLRVLAAQPVDMAR